MARNSGSACNTFDPPVSIPTASRRLANLLAFLSVGPLCALVLGCSVSSSSGKQSTQQTNQTATSTGVVAASFFGMVVKSAAHHPTVETGSRRLWDSGVTWAALEPTAASYNWSTLDSEVSAAQAAGASVTLTLGMTPTWASSNPSLASAFGAGATAMPTDLTTWDAYVTAVATRYKGRIAGYEVWNAPSDATYWSGASDQLGTNMAALSAHAAAAVHAVDTDAVIIAPALSADGLQQFLSAGGSASVDVFTASLSVASQAPEAMVDELSAIRAVMNNTSADSKPLWNNQPSWTLPSDGLSDADQAAYAARSLILNASFGLSRLSWYAWDESDSTALRLSDGGGQPTAAANAYGVVEGWLSGAAVNGCSENAEQLWSCQLVRNGKAQWILWSAADSFEASGLSMSTVTSLDGSQQAIDASGLVTVSASPILLQ